jgi:hypothetical protein
VGGGDVRGDGRGDADGEGEPGEGPYAVAASFVVGHDDGRDEQHPVDAERQGVGDLGSFSVPQDRWTIWEYDDHAAIRATPPETRFRTVVMPLTAILSSGVLV